MSLFYVRVAKALVSSFDISTSQEKKSCSYHTRSNLHLGSDFIAYSRETQRETRV